MAEGEIRLKARADVGDANREISGMFDNLRNERLKDQKANEKFQKFVQGQTSQTVRQEKKAFKQATAALKKEQAERMKVFKGTADQRAKLHRASLDKITAMERQHAKRLEALRGQTAKGRAVNRFNMASQAAGGGLLGSIKGITAAAGPMGFALTGAVASVAAIMGKASAKFNEMEDNTRRIKTLLSADQAEKLPGAVAKLREVSTATGRPLAELQQSLYDVISAVPSLANNLGAAAEVSEKAAKAAIGLGTDTGKVTNAMTNLANAAGISLETAKNQDFVLDQLATTMKLGKVSGEGLASSIAKAAPTMAALTDGAENTVQTIGQMTAMLTANGVSVDESQTAIKALAAELLKTGKAGELAAMGLEGIDESTGKVTDWTALMKSAGKDVNKFAAELGSIEAQNALRILAKEGGAAFEQLTNDFNAGAGAANAMFTEMASSSEVASNRVDAAMDNLLISVGEGSGGIVTGAKNMFADALNFVADLFKSSEQKFIESTARLNELMNTSSQVIDAVAGVDEILSQPPTQEGISAAIANIREQMSLVGEISPGIAGEMQRILQAEGGENATVATVEKLNDLLRQTGDIAKGLALKEQIEQAALGVDALEEKLEELADVGGFFDSPFVGAGQAADVIAQNIAEATAEMTELRNQGELSLEDQIRLGELTGEIASQKANLQAVEGEINNRVAEQLETAKAAAEAVGVEFNQAEALAGIQAKITKEMNATGTTAQMIADAGAAALKNAEEQAKAAAEQAELAAIQAEEKSKTVELDTAVHALLDAQMKVSAELAGQEEHKNQSKIRALEAEELKNQQIINQLQTQLASMDGIIAGTMDWAEASEVVARTQQQIKEIQEGTRTEVEEVPTEVNAQNIEARRAELQERIEGLTQLNEDMAKKRKSLEKEIIDDQKKAAEKERKADERGTRDQISTRQRGQRSRLQDESSHISNMESTRDNRLRGRLDQARESAESIEEMRDTRSGQRLERESNIMDEYQERYNRNAQARADADKQSAEAAARAQEEIHAAIEESRKALMGAGSEAAQALTGIVTGTEIEEFLSGRQAGMTGPEALRQTGLAEPRREALGAGIREIIRQADESSTQYIQTVQDLKDIGLDPALESTQELMANAQDFGDAIVNARVAMVDLLTDGIQPASNEIEEGFVRALGESRDLWAENAARVAEVEAKAAEAQEKQSNSIVEQTELDARRAVILENLKKIQDDIRAGAEAAASEKAAQEVEFRNDLEQAKAGLQALFDLQELGRQGAELDYNQREQLRNIDSEIAKQRARITLFEQQAAAASAEHAAFVESQKERTDEQLANVQAVADLELERLDRIKAANEALAKSNKEQDKTEKKAEDVRRTLGGWIGAINEFAEALKKSEDGIDTLEKGFAAIAQGVDIMNQGMDGSLQLLDAFSSSGEQAQELGGQFADSLFGVAGAITGLPIGEVFSGIGQAFTKIADRINKSDREALERRQRAVASLRREQGILEMNLSAIRERIELEQTLNNVLVSRTDESSERLEALAREKGELESLLQFHMDTLAKIEERNRRRELGFMGSMEPDDVSLSEITADVDLSDPMELLKIIDDSNFALQNSANLSEESKNTIQERIDAARRLLDIMRETAREQRGEFQDQIKVLEHRKKMGEFDGNEADFLQQKLEIQQELERVALEQFDQELITQDELFKIQEDRYSLEKEIQALRDGGLTTEQQILQEKIRQLNIERQRLILLKRAGQISPEQEARIRAIETDIILSMQQAGASPEAIQAAREGFSMASFDVGTPFVPRDMVAKVHEGERIFTRTENRDLLRILSRDPAASLKPLIRDMSRVLSANRAFSLSPPLSLSPPTSKNTLNLTINGATNPGQVAHAVRQEWDRWHRDIHMREGTAGNR